MIALKSDCFVPDGVACSLSSTQTKELSIQGASREEPLEPPERT